MFKAWVLILASLLQSVAFPGPGNSHATFPPNVTAGLQIWYRADGVVCSLGSSCTNGATAIKWTDWSGHSNNALPCSPGPGIFKTNVVNGNPAVEFGGGNCYTLTTPIAIVPGITMFAVFKNLVYTQGAIVSNPTNDYIWYVPDTSFATMQSISGVVSGAASPDMNWHYGEIDYEPGVGDGFIWQDGLLDVSGPANITPTGSIQEIGINQFCNCLFLNAQLAELIVYDRVLTGPEQTAINSYLAARYGL